jgi:hypothetical protein
MKVTMMFVACIGAMSHLQFALLGYEAEPEPSLKDPLAVVKVLHDVSHPVQGRLICTQHVSAFSSVQV